MATINAIDGGALSRTDGVERQRRTTEATIVAWTCFYALLSGNGVKESLTRIAGESLAISTALRSTGHVCRGSSPSHFEHQFVSASRHKLKIEV